MIVSHHGTPEFGSVKLPMTPEAVALHYLDNLDAKIHAFTREIRDDPCKDTNWTPFHPSMNRRLFKGEPANGDESSGRLGLLIGSVGDLMSGDQAQSFLEKVDEPYGHF